MHAEKSEQLPVRKRSFKTTFTLYENTYADGRRVYETQSTPLVVRTLHKPSLSKQRSTALSVIPSNVSATPNTPSESFSYPRIANQPFLTRMYARQLRSFDRFNNNKAIVTRSNNFAPHAELVPEIAELPSTAETGEISDDPPTIGQTFMGEESIEDIEQGNPVTWQLISVKRQRKLKMKKHKYKKLLKRTKNIRRRLDRL